MTARFLYRPGEVPEYLTPSALYGVQRAAVRRWADAGLIESVRTLGGHRRYPSAQFAALIADITGAAGQENAA